MKTVLYDRHVELHAKMVEFAGWQMPIQYTGILEEHMAVREKVGLFDVSHMGIIWVTGPDSGKLLDYLSTNQILGKDKHTAIYTVWAQEEGGCVDDVIVYCEDETHYFVVVNASNRMKSFNHLKKYAQGFKVHIQDRFQEDGILALQGPNALALISPLFLEAKNIKKMHFVPLLYHGEKIILSRTGYTGELGFEIYAPNKLIVELFDWFINEGKPFGLACVGLGARDTLRLEMGYTLYGHEISETISANESLSAWTIKWNKHDFVGLKFMKELEKSHVLRHEYGVVLEDPGIGRDGFDVLQNDILIGKVTSGSFSPVLNKAIAIILVNKKLQEGESIYIKIRQNIVQAKVNHLPFFAVH
jgi:aminomethyltransferase